jgi:AraC-like DNA-binding protein
VWDSADSGRPLHWQKYLEVFHIVKGRADISINGKLYSLKDGDTAVINPEMIHGYVNQSAHTRHIVFLFSIDLFNQFLPELRDKDSQMMIFSRKTLIFAETDSKVCRRMARIIHSISREYLSMNEGYRLAIRKYLYEMALLYLREIPPVKNKPSRAAKEYSNFPAFERALSFIHKNFKTPGITLKDAAAVASLSEFYFSRLFRDRTGETFHAYLARLRVMRAREYLSDSDIPITDIIYKCGFASQQTFNRQFYTHTGVSPSFYRSGTRVRRQA